MMSAAGGLGGGGAPLKQEPGSALRRRRDELAEQVAELHWNLGGLTYEMAIRDHFRLDVLIRRAAMLQERDAELAEVERLLHMQESGTAGDCPSCGAVRSRGAVFCWQCGAQMMERTSTNGGHQASEVAQVPTIVQEMDLADRPGSPVQAEPEPTASRDLARPVQAGS